MSEINIKTNESFEKEVLKSDKPVVVDFFATWCGPCQMLSPIISEIATEYENKIKVCKVNVDENQDLAMKYQIASIPTLMIFKNGNLVKTCVGFISKNELESIIEEL